jgi:hypothetical protein
MKKFIRNSATAVAKNEAAYIGKNFERSDQPATCGEKEEK